MRTIRNRLTPVGAYRGLPEMPCVAICAILSAEGTITAGIAIRATVRRCSDRADRIFCHPIGGATFDIFFVKNAERPILPIISFVAQLRKKSFLHIS